MPRDSDTRMSPLWLAAGTGLVGVSLGAAAVLLGLQRGQREQRSRERPAAPPVVATPARSPDVSTPVAAAAPQTLVAAVAATRRAVVTVDTPQMLGAGVIVDERGIVITNAHVIAKALQASSGWRAEAAPTVTVRFEDGRELPATVLVADHQEDLAILRIRSAAPEERFEAVALGRSAELQVGQEVFAVGHPFGLAHSVSRGIVSAVDRTRTHGNQALPLIQLDASINLGNSGGPLFARDGSLVGIVTARSKDAEGIGFAVPVDHVRGFLRAVSDPAAPRRSGAIGVTLDASPVGRAEPQQGYRAWLSVRDVLPQSTAAAAGLVVGDVVVEVRGKRLDSLENAEAPGTLLFHLVSTVRSLFPGERFELAVLRQGRVERIEVEVGTAPPDRQVQIDTEELLGLRLDPEQAAPVVRGLMPNSPFGRFGSQLDGARIVRLMDRDIDTLEALGEPLRRVRELLRDHGRVLVSVSMRDARDATMRPMLVLVE